MKVFKSVSRKKKNLTKFKVYFTLIFLMILFCFIFKDELIISKKNVKKIISSSLGLNYSTKKEKTVFKENIEEEKNAQPLIYIYSTHSYEEYISLDNPYNVPYTVMFADFLLQNELEKYSIYSIREENSTKKYEQSRVNIETTAKNYSSIKYFIDVHRDSGTHALTTYETEEKSYAKFLFVIGTGYETYEKNKNLASKLNDIVESIVPGISRGLFIREGAVYNADFSENALLIEVGSEANYIEEVTNSIEVLAKAISILVGEENAS